MTLNQETSRLSYRSRDLGGRKGLGLVLSILSTAVRAKKQTTNYCLNFVIVMTDFLNLFICTLCGQFATKYVVT